MSSAVGELEAGLQALLGLKPPGVSGSRIASLTALCVANVQVRSIVLAAGHLELGTEAVTNGMFA